jgi:hypothetical protein
MLHINRQTVRWSLETGLRPADWNCGSLTLSGALSHCLEEHQMAVPVAVAELEKRNMRQYTTHQLMKSQRSRTSVSSSGSVASLLCVDGGPHFQAPYHMGGKQSSAAAPAASAVPAPSLGELKHPLTTTSFTASELEASRAYLAAQSQGLRWKYGTYGTASSVCNRSTYPSISLVFRLSADCARENADRQSDIAARNGQRLAAATQRTNH